VPESGSLTLRRHPSGFAYVEYQNAWFDMGGTINWNFQNGATIIVMATAPPTGAFYARIFEFSSDASGYNSLLLARSATTANVDFSIFGTGSMLMKDVQNDVFNGEWMVFAVTVSTNRYAVYVDGVQLSTGTYAPGFNDRSTTQNWLGKSSWTIDDLARDMGLRQIAIYHKEMTQAEVVTATAALVASCQPVQPGEECTLRLPTS
jgi:hypothetical protein